MVCWNNGHLSHRPKFTPGCPGFEPWMPLSMFTGFLPAYVGNLFLCIVSLLGPNFSTWLPKKLVCQTQQNIDRFETTLINIIKKSNALTVGPNSIRVKILPNSQRRGFCLLDLVKWPLLATLLLVSRTQRIHSFQYLLIQMPIT